MHYIAVLIDTKWKAYRIPSFHKEGTVRNLKIWIFSHLLSALQEAHCPKEIKQKSFQYEIRAISTEILVDET